MSNMSMTQAPILPNMSNKEPQTENSTLASPSASYSVTVRLRLRNVPGMLGKVTSTIGELGADIGAVDIAGFEKDSVIRDITFSARDVEHGETICEQL